MASRAARCFWLGDDLSTDVSHFRWFSPGFAFRFAVDVMVYFVRIYINKYLFLSHLLDFLSALEEGFGLQMVPMFA
jgi:hypothetical protein